MWPWLLCSLLMSVGLVSWTPSPLKSPEEQTSSHQLVRELVTTRRYSQELELRLGKFTSQLARVALENTKTVAGGGQ